MMMTMLCSDDNYDNYAVCSAVGYYSSQTKPPTNSTMLLANPTLLVMAQSDRPVDGDYVNNFVSAGLKTSFCSWFFFFLVDTHNNFCSLLMLSCSLLLKVTLYNPSFSAAKIAVPPVGTDTSWGGGWNYDWTSLYLDEAFHTTLRLQEILNYGTSNLFTQSFALQLCAHSFLCACSSTPATMIVWFISQSFIICWPQILSYSIRLSVLHQIPWYGMPLCRALDLRWRRQHPIVGKWLGSEISIIIRILISEISIIIRIEPHRKLL